MLSKYQKLNKWIYDWEWHDGYVTGSRTIQEIRFGVADGYVVVSLKPVMAD